MGHIDAREHELAGAPRPIRMGHERVAANRPGLAGRGSIEVRSAAFADGEVIPRRYAGDGEDVSPPLAWSHVPRETREVAVLCEDPDAPMASPFVHWLVHGLPPGVRALGEGVTRATFVPGLPPAHQGRNSGQDTGYMGPLPPPGHGVHHYYFEVFALDQPLGLRALCTRDELVQAMRGHVLASGVLVGTYERG